MKKLLFLLFTIISINCISQSHVKTVEVGPIVPNPASQSALEDSAANLEAMIMQRLLIDDTDLVRAPLIDAININTDSINSKGTQIGGLAATFPFKLSNSDTGAAWTPYRVYMEKLKDTSVTHLTRLAKHDDSLNAHNNRLNIKRDISDTSTNGVSTVYSRNYLRDSLNLVNRNALGDSSYGLAPTSNAWFFGTSITVGNSLYYKYSTAVANLLNMYEVNRGTGGSYMKFTSVGDSSMVDKIYTLPNNSSSVGMVFFEYGTNDAEIGDTAGFRAAYHKVMDSATIAKSLPGSKLALLSIHYRLKPAASLPRDTTYNRIIHEVATAYGAYYIDTRTPGFEIKSALSTDSVHPLIQGHFIIARATLDGLPNKDKGYLFSKGTIVANKMSIEGRMGSDNGGASSSGTAAYFGTYFEAGANNQSFYQATFAPNINANGFTGGIAYAARYRAHLIFDNNKTFFGTKSDGSTYSFFNLSGSNLATIGQNNTSLELFGNPFSLNYRNNMTWTDNNTGNKTFTMFATTANALFKNGGTHTDTAGNTLSVQGNVNLTGTLKISGGAGTATLVAGTVTVNNAYVTANSVIILTPQETGTLNGRVRVSARVAGTSFTITSSDSGDTAAIGYTIIVK